MNRIATSYKNQEVSIARKWAEEMHLIMGPRDIKDHYVDLRVLDHLERCQKSMDGLPIRSMFFLLENTSLKYLFVSKSVSDVLGYTRKEVTGNGFEWLFTLFSEDELEYKKQVMADLYEYFKTLDQEKLLNCTVRYDLVVSRKDGKMVHLLEEMMYPEVNALGEPVVTSCFLHDIGAYAGADKRNCQVFLRSNGMDEVVYNKSYTISRSADAPLSNREIEILQQLANGQTTKQVAAKLFVSENTIKTHRKRMLQKLNVQNTAEAIKVAMGKGWV